MLGTDLKPAKSHCCHEALILVDIDNNVVNKINSS